MKKILLIILLVFITSIVYGQWEGEGDMKTPVDIAPLDLGFYTSAATVTGSVSTIPLYGNFDGRHNLTITNSDYYCSVYIFPGPAYNPVDQGYELLAGNTISLDIGDSPTNSVVYIATSDSTISVSVSTIEIR